MTKLPNPWRRTSPFAAADLDAELARLATLGVEALRALWREQKGQDPPKTASRDLMARALAHWLQEERLGGLRPHLRKLLASVAGKDVAPMRHVKAGSVIVREYQGCVHEVIVTPDGFLWAGRVYASLSTIARKITGASWSGPRFFGLRGEEPAPSPAIARGKAQPKRQSRCAPSSVPLSRLRRSSERPEDRA